MVLHHLISSTNPAIISSLLSFILFMLVLTVLLSLRWIGAIAPSLPTLALYRPVLANPSIAYPAIVLASPANALGLLELSWVS